MEVIFVPEKFQTLKYTRVHMRHIKRKRFLALLDNNNNYERVMMILKSIINIQAGEQFVTIVELTVTGMNMSKNY